MQVSLEAVMWHYLKDNYPSGYEGTERELALEELRSESYRKARHIERAVKARIQAIERLERKGKVSLIEFGRVDLVSGASL